MLPNWLPWSNDVIRRCFAGSQTPHRKKGRRFTALARVPASG